MRHDGSFRLRANNQRMTCVRIIINLLCGLLGANLKAHCHLAQKKKKNHSEADRKFRVYSSRENLMPICPITAHQHQRQKRDAAFVLISEHV